ncbi:MAG TPA: hypothetical protein VGB20_00725 [bacterium]
MRRVLTASLALAALLAEPGSARALPEELMEANRAYYLLSAHGVRGFQCDASHNVLDEAYAAYAPDWGAQDPRIQVLGALRIQVRYTEAEGAVVEVAGVEPTGDPGFDQWLESVLAQAKGLLRASLSVWARYHARPLFDPAGTFRMEAFEGGLRVWYTTEELEEVTVRLDEQHRVIEELRHTPKAVTKRVPVFVKSPQGWVISTLGIDISPVMDKPVRHVVLYRYETVAGARLPSRIRDQQTLPQSAVWEVGLSNCRLTEESGLKRIDLPSLPRRPL